MKYIIDIPEEVKQKIDENLNSCDLDIYDCVMLATKNGTPLEDQLEQLKADIKEASYDRLDGFNGGQMVVDWEDIEDMFYDHISKLKGET